MSTHCTHHRIQLRVFNAHALLPRVLLVFSRRRIRIKALHFHDVLGDRPAEMQVDVDCGTVIADQLVKQLNKIVEVQSAASKAVDRQCSPWPGRGG